MGSKQPSAYRSLLCAENDASFFLLSYYSTDRPELQDTDRSENDLIKGFPVKVKIKYLAGLNANSPADALLRRTVSAHMNHKISAFSTCFLRDNML